MYLLKNIQIGPGAHPASYILGTEGISNRSSCGQRCFGFHIRSLTIFVLYGCRRYSIPRKDKLLFFCRHIQTVFAAGLYRELLNVLEPDADVKNGGMHTLTCLPPPIHTRVACPSREKAHVVIRVKRKLAVTC